MQNIKLIIICIIMTGLVSPLFADEQQDGGFSFSFDLGIGTQTFNEPSGPVTYQSLNLLPEFKIGKFGLGLDLTFNFRFTDETGSFDFRTEDWIPAGITPAEKFQSFMEIYLPIFRYISYGEKNEPFYAKLGSIDDGLLGNGFIVGNYSNTNFLPDKRIVGLSMDIDGKLFNFPYIGLETFIANLAVFDVMGARLYVRPLAWMDIAILKDLEIGVTYAVDTQPDAAIDFVVVAGEPEPVQMVGFDIFDPIVYTEVFTLAAFGDFVIQPRAAETAVGGMIGFGGRFFKVIPYALQLRILGDNFVPVYFDANYDLYREAKYTITNGDTPVPAFTGWMASLGFSFFDDMLVFNASIDSPFVINDSISSIIGHPHLRIVLLVQEGILPGFSFSASLDRVNLDQVTSWDNFWTDYMVIGAKINYDTGPAVLTLSYDLRYNPAPEPGQPSWETTATLSSTFNVF